MAIDNNKMQELLAAFKNDPQFFVTTIFGEKHALRPKQLEFFEKFIGNDHITFKGGVGFGKTRVMAIAVWWALFCFNDLKVNIFGPSEKQIQDNLWNEIGILYNLIPEAIKEQFEYTPSIAYRKGSRNECFATYWAANQNNLGTSRGIHATNNFVFVDEASDVPNVVFTNLENIMTDVNPKLVIVSNPAHTSGFFYDTWEHKTISKAWTKVHGRMADNPNMTKEKLDAQIAVHGGVGSRNHRIMVEGEFPLDDVAGVIPLAAVLEAANEEDAIPPHDAPVIWGLDPNGGGKDRSALAKRHDNVVLEKVKEFKDLDAVQLAQAIYDEYRATPQKLKPAEICVDANGPGYGVYTMLLSMGLPAKKVMAQSSPTRDQQLYSRLRDQLWWACREWFVGGGVSIPNDAELMKELTVPTYDYEATGKIKVESKPEIRKRNKNSPDLADALCLTFASNAKQHVGKWAWSKPIEYDVRHYQ